MFNVGKMAAAVAFIIFLLFYFIVDEVRYLMTLTIRIGHF